MFVHICLINIFEICHQTNKSIVYGGSQLAYNLQQTAIQMGAVSDPLLNVYWDAARNWEIQMHIWSGNKPEM